MELETCSPSVHADKIESASTHDLAIRSMLSQHSLGKPRDKVKHILKDCSLLQEILWDDLLAIVQSQIGAIVQVNEVADTCDLNELDCKDHVLQRLEEGDSNDARATTETIVALRRGVN